MLSRLKEVIVFGLSVAFMMALSHLSWGAEASSEAELIQVQNEAPAANRTSPNARTAARNWFKDPTIRKKGLKQNWDPKKNRMMKIGSAEANIGPSNIDDFMDIRNNLYVEAELKAKAAIIETFMTTASAENIMSVPGNPIAKQLEKDNRELKRALENQEKNAAQAQKDAAAILASVDNAQADELSGVSVGDRLNRLLEAAIKKIDESYTEGAIAEDKKERVEELKQRWQLAQQYAAQATAKKDMIADRLKAIQGDLKKETRSTVETHSDMPLFGAVTMQQFESYNDLKGIFELAIVVGWSPKLEQQARSILLTQGESRKPRPNAKSFDDWLYSRDLSTMIGTRKQLAQDGSINFVGISAVSYDPDDGGSYDDAEFEAEMWAKQHAILSLTGDMESTKRAERLVRQVIGADGKRKEEVLKDMSREMRNSVEGLTLSGLETYAGEELTHPASGQPIVVVVARVNSDIAAKASSMMADTYATLKELNEDQSFRVGQKEGMVSAADASKNDVAARAAGFADGSQAVNQEFVNRNAAATRNSASASQARRASNSAPAPTARPAETQSGTWGGDEDIDDDF